MQQNSNILIQTLYKTVLLKLNLGLLIHKNLNLAY